MSRLAGIVHRLTFDNKTKALDEIIQAYRENALDIRLIEKTGNDFRSIDWRKALKGKLI
jgi:hypothetical protein